MTARQTGWGLWAGVAVLAPMLLGGCFGSADRSVASAEPVDLRTSVAAAEAQPPIRTVKHGGSVSRRLDAEDPDPRDAALPTPSEIFDFHPAGSKPDAWRQPFVIDPNDGPLSGYVRRMDAELSESNRQTKSAAVAPVRKKVCPSGGPVGTISASCGENDVAKGLAR